MECHIIAKNDNIKLSIIIPLYNEESSVTTVLDNLFALNIDGNGDILDIVVVDDHSTDASVASVESHKEFDKRLSLVKHDVNQGKGAAVRTGIDACNGDTILIQDADLELSPADIPELIKAYKSSRFQLVNGSRYLPGPVRPLYSYKRYFFNKIFSNLASMLIDVRFTDIACGYKMFSKELYNSLNLKEKRFGFEAELIIKTAKLNKTQIAEVPVNYFPRNKGAGKKIRNMDGLRIFWVILKYGFG